MHQYSMDRKIRERIVYITVVLSAALSIALKEVCADILSGLDSIIAGSSVLADLAFKSAEIIPNVIGIPVIYWILSTVFDKWLWKTKPINLILKVPDLNGVWEGTLCSSYDGQSIPMKLEIHQTWNKIECTSYFDKSGSTSNVAAVYSEESGGPVLYFGFHNQSKDISTGTQSYDGYNILHVRKDKLTGEYFNNRPNPKKTVKGGNLGTIELTLNKKGKRNGCNK